MCLNGAAARLVAVGDRVIIVSYTQVETGSGGLDATVVLLGERNTRLER